MTQIRKLERMAKEISLLDIDDFNFLLNDVEKQRKLIITFVKRG